MVYGAFFVGAYSTAFLGWRAATTMRTSLGLDALEHALRTRQREHRASLASLVHHRRGLAIYVDLLLPSRSPGRFKLLRVNCCW